MKTMTETRSIEGALLDYYVGRALGKRVSIWKVCDSEIEECRAKTSTGVIKPWAPSAVWRDGGIIIERSKVSVIAEIHDGTFCSWTARTMGGGTGSGPTLLVAAMRALVMEHFGLAVDGAPT